MTSWKQSVLVVFLLVWIGTFMLVSRMQRDTKFPKPFRQNSLGQPMKEETHTEAELNIHHEPNKTVTFNQLKKILFFTQYFSTNDWEFGFGQQPFIDYQCPVTNCYTTNNKSLLGKQMNILFLCL